MRKLGVTLVIAAALLLGGCASAAPAGETANGDTAPSAAPITMAPDASASAEPTDNPYGDEGEQAATFLESIRQSWRGDLPADEQLLSAASLACEQAAAGTAVSDIRVVQGEGEDAEWNNGQVAHQAIGIMCPEYDS